MRIGSLFLLSALATLGCRQIVGLEEGNFPPTDGETDTDVTDLEIPPDGSCTLDADCSDGNPCNGTETCDPLRRACLPGTDLADGTQCDSGGTRMICLSSRCVDSICGDGFVDDGGGEQCEPPGSSTCDDTCLIICTGDADCPDDASLCNGEEYCSLDTGRCSHRSAPPDGTVCGADPRSICLDGECGPGICGDGFTDAGAEPPEQCDDGNEVEGDGCDGDCTYSCLDDGACADGEVCNGDETCSQETHACLPGTDQPEGTPCVDDDPCTIEESCDGSGSCVGQVLVLENAAALAAGHSHACAVVADGQVKCWGDNGSGQLGDGTTDDRSGPVLVAGLEAAAGICAGERHSCALLASGGVMCWGSNVDGQLGDGSSTDSPVPVAVTGLESGAAAVGCGARHSCAVMAAGSVLCWGRNAEGQLGDGTTVAVRLTPVDVSGLSSGVSAVEGGSSHTCGVAGSGAWCWGLNGSGQLGDGTHGSRRTPVAVDGLESGVLAVTAGGEHSCALSSGGLAMCWGANDDGQVGDGTTLEKALAVAVSGLSSGTADISAGWNHTCALGPAGEGFCWGANESGQLGNGSTDASSSPAAVSGLSSGGTSIAAGGAFTCALQSAGTVLCWGSNSDGQLGDGTNTDSLTPVQVSCR